MPHDMGDIAAEFLFWFMSDAVSRETRLIISRLLPEISTRRSTSKSGTYQKGLLIALLEESHKEYLQVSLQAYSALMCPHELTSQDPWRSRWPQERDVEQSALTHARHTHCASRQLGTTADRSMMFLGTDFEKRAIWQGYVEEPAAEDFVARKVCTIKWSKV